MCEVCGHWHGSQVTLPCIAVRGCMLELCVRGGEGRGFEKWRLIAMGSEHDAWMLAGVWGAARPVRVSACADAGTWSMGLKSCSNLLIIESLREAP